MCYLYVQLCTWLCGMWLSEVNNAYSWVNCTLLEGGQWTVVRCSGRCSGGNGCIRLFNAYALVSSGQLDAAGSVSDGLCCLDGWRVAGRVV